MKEPLNMEFLITVLRKKMQPDLNIRNTLHYVERYILIVEQAEINLIITYTSDMAEHILHPLLLLYKTVLLFAL